MVLHTNAVIMLYLCVSTSWVSIEVGDEGIVSSPAEKDLGFVGDEKLT